MTKSLVINPFDVRARGTVRCPEVPVNAYQMDLSSEVNRYGGDRLVNILADMVVIREFETMLNQLQTAGSYGTVTTQLPGLQHVAIGQEAAVVGQAIELAPVDLVFGSHRSHGEVLAKSFSAARQLPAEQVRQIMERYQDGQILRQAEVMAHDDESDLVANFILFGTLAEIFGRRTGFNHGLSGSLHAFFAPFGSMPNNAVVGGSAPIATGAALFKRVNRIPGIVVANLGDAAMGAGAVWESMGLAAMDQYRQLWPEEVGGNPPVLFSFFNNFYGMGGQTYGETMGYEILARVGTGVNPEGMYAERVDGYNPLAVANAVRRKKEILLSGEGPVLLDIITYRLAGDSPLDKHAKRTKEEVGLWEQVDSIKDYAAALVDGGLLTTDRAEQMKAKAAEKLGMILSVAADDQACPRMDPHFVETVMMSNRHAEALAPGVAQILTPLADNVRVREITEKVRTGEEQTYQLRDGLFEAISHRFAVDPTMAAWGQQNRDGGSFGVYDGLSELVGYNRLFNAPVSEAAIVGAGVGYAMVGGRAVVELMYDDFLARAADELFNQAAKWQAMSAGLLTMPLVVRMVVGSGMSPQHCQDWSGMLAHVPGLKVYYPATPTDAKGMLNLALAGTDPVMFLESQALYDTVEQFEEGGVPIGYYETAEGEPALRRAGTDLTIATYGPALYTAMGAAKRLEEYGLSAEVIDLRFMVPLKYDKLFASVAQTGRLLLVSDAVERGSFLHTVASAVTQEAFDDLDAPVVVLGSPNVLGSVAARPQVETILDVINDRIVPLKGYGASPS